MTVPAVTTGNDSAAGVGTTEHAWCHSDSVQRRALTEAQAAWACGYVTLVHGSAPVREHTVEELTP